MLPLVSSVLESENKPIKRPGYTLSVVPLLMKGDEPPLLCVNISTSHDLEGEEYFCANCISGMFPFWRRIFAVRQAYVLTFWFSPKTFSFFQCLMSQLPFKKEKKEKVGPGATLKFKTALLLGGISLH